MESSFATPVKKPRIFCPYCLAGMRPEEAAKRRTDTVNDIAVQWCIECNESFMIDVSGSTKAMAMPQVPTSGKRKTEEEYDEFNAILFRKVLLRQNHPTERLW